MAVVIVSDKERKKHNIKRRLTRKIGSNPPIQTDPQQLQPAPIPPVAQIPALALNINPKPPVQPGKINLMLTTVVVSRIHLQDSAGPHNKVLVVGC